MDHRNDGIVPPQNTLEKILSSNYTLGCVLLLALLLRIGHVLSLRSLPLFNRLIIDSEVYDKWAQYIAAGNWLGGNTAFVMDPLYPYFLAVIYKIFGHDLLVVRLLQAGLGVGTCALVAIIGYRVSQNKAVGTLAAFLTAIYGPAIFQEAEIEKTALGIFLITAALAFATKPRPVSCLFAGVFLALAALTRGNLVLLLPLGALYFFIVSEEPQDKSLDFKGWFSMRVTGKQGKNAIVFMLGGMLMLSPSLIRNHHVSGEWIIITSMSGQNFYTGNNPYNDVGAYTPLPFVRPQSSNEEADFRAMAESMAGKKLTQGEASSFWFRETIKHVVENPLYATKVFIRKFLMFWSNVEIADAWDYYFLKRYSPVLNLPLLNFGLLMALAAMGAMAFYKTAKGAKLVIGFIIAYSITVIAFFILSRYRIHVVPPLAVLSSLGLLWLWNQLRDGNWQKVLPHSIVAILVFVFSVMGVSTLGYSAHEHVNSYTLLAELYRMNGDLVSAEGLLKDALQKFDNDPSTLQAVGLLYLSKKEPDKALESFSRCIQKNETYPDAWYLLGATQEGLGNTSEAIKSYRKQLRIIPKHELSINRLSKLGQAL